METYHIIILRIIHIGFGMFWGGVALFMPMFLLPAVKAFGPEGGRFMQILMQAKKLKLIFNLS